MCLKQVKRRKKIALASMLSVVMLMSGFAGVAKASTEGVYTYKNNTGKMVASVDSGERGYGDIYYPVKTDLSLTVRLYYINTNGKMCPGNSSSTSGCTTQVGTSFSLSSKYKNQGYKVAKVRSTGQISGSTFVNKRTGKSYVEDLR